MAPPLSIWMRLAAAMCAAATVCALVACGGGGASGSPGLSPIEPPVLPTLDVAPVLAQDPGSSLAADWAQGTFMQIFVRAYQDSDGDGMGDLKGLIQRLDYLKDLGVTGIWLMPVTASQDHDHGYAVSNYRSMEVQYGSLADMDELLRQAHARGIGVILDYVMNHSAALHPAFVNASTAGNNSFRDWYLWQSSRPIGWSIYGGDPWRVAATGLYFAPFSEQMPDFNLANTAVVNWHHDNLRFWMNRGVDGFRFDAVGNLVENGPTAWENQPQNYTLMGAVRGMMDGYRQRYLVCEAPADPAGFARSTACGSAFAFGHNTKILRAANGDVAALQAVADYPKTVPPGMATLLANHDLFAGDRVWNQVGGDWARYRMAAATYLLQPGVPFVYYGEEIGMAAAASIGHDGRLRTPMSWTADAVKAGFTTGIPFRLLSSNAGTQNVASQLTDPQSMLSFYRGLLGLRKARVSLRSGGYASSQVSGSALSFSRVAGNEQTVVALNYGTAPVAVTLKGLVPSGAYGGLWPVNQSALNVDAAGTAVVTVPAQTVFVWGR